MKKLGTVLGFALLFLLFSSFIVQKSADATLTHLSTDANAHFGFWKKLSLFGTAGAGLWLARRRFRRHFGGGGFGCLGFLLALIVGVIAIALLPVVLAVALVLVICGVSLGGSRRYRRRRRYE